MQIAEWSQKKSLEARSGERSKGGGSNISHALLRHQRTSYGRAGDEVACRIVVIRIQPLLHLLLERTNNVADKSSVYSRCWVRRPSSVPKAEWNAWHGHTKRAERRRYSHISRKPPSRRLDDQPTRSDFQDQPSVFLHISQNGERTRRAR